MLPSERFVRSGVNGLRGVLVFQCSEATARAEGQCKTTQCPPVRRACGRLAMRRKSLTSSRVLQRAARNTQAVPLSRIQSGALPDVTRPAERMCCAAPQTSRRSAHQA
eukprot:529440-Prymnesium_polylepis.1